VIARPGAGHVQKLALGVVDVLKGCFVANRLDARLRRYHLVIAGHHRDGPELEEARLAAGQLSELPAQSIGERVGEGREQTPVFGKSAASITGTISAGARRRSRISVSFVFMRVGVRPSPLSIRAERCINEKAASKKAASSLRVAAGTAVLQNTQDRERG
jgi:hypothetical protein